MKTFNLKGTTRDIHVIQDSPFKGKQDLEIKHKICVPVLHGNKTIVTVTLTYTKVRYMCISTAIRKEEK